MFKDISPVLQDPELFRHTIELMAGVVARSAAQPDVIVAIEARGFVFGAALDAGRDVQAIGHLAQGSDHPVALTFPEGAYLKGLICRVA